ncbi:cupin domain-containing protein [Lichenibacterium ramalinae]|uniref:Cupin domain-containing protein n=1 Tax=Lichenibacterium ramalinae TaxID=2316527 RepID=A0A4V1RI44_9HYPH|nr:cupin domain-containing protein [Lichenibacterium ramalinae]RYB02267.1 cupin domain-containing protein [Lichenibacterium ramalinae]
MAFTCTVPAVPTVLADDDRVRITRWDFTPGATTGWHEHAMPYAIVMVTAGTMLVDAGTGEPARVVLEAGAAYSRPAGVRHDVMNGGEAPMSFVEVEHKG